LVSRALSPAKPVQLFIDDDKNYCVALFDDENLDAAIGRNGMNINLASQLTEYRIDAYGVKQYARIQEDHKTSLSEIEGVSTEVSDGLSAMGINVVSDLLDADMDVLLSANDVDEDSLDTIYEAVQSFVERQLESQSEDEESEEINIDSDDEVAKDDLESETIQSVETEVIMEGSIIDSKETHDINDVIDDSVTENDGKSQSEDEPIIETAD